MRLKITLKETYSIVWKRHKTNQELANGNYYNTKFEFQLFQQVAKHKNRVSIISKMAKYKNKISIIIKGGLFTWPNKYDWKNMTKFLWTWPTLQQWQALFIEYDQNSNWQTLIIRTDLSSRLFRMYVWWLFEEKLCVSDYFL